MDLKIMQLNIGTLIAMLDALIERVDALELKLK